MVLIVAMVMAAMLYLLRRVQRVGVPCASSPSSSSEQDEEPSWKLHESSPQTPTYERTEGCTGKDLRRKRGSEEEVRRRRRRGGGSEEEERRRRKCGGRGGGGREEEEVRRKRK